MLHRNYAHVMALEYGLRAVCLLLQRSQLVRLKDSLDVCHYMFLMTAKCILPLYCVLPTTHFALTQDCTCSYLVSFQLSPVEKRLTPVGRLVLQDFLTIHMVS
jgi:hypothetical protein